MSKEEKSPASKPEPKQEPKLPAGAYITRHGNIIQNGTDPLPDETK